MRNAKHAIQNAKCPARLVAILNFSLHVLHFQFLFSSGLAAPGSIRYTPCGARRRPADGVKRPDGEHPHRR
jgi:hypothetical protein